MVCEICEQIMADPALQNQILGGALGGVLATVGFLIGLLILIGIYVYTALAWYSIAKSLKYKYPWLAWIPFANVSMMLQLGGFHWAWIFLTLTIIGIIPLLVLIIIANWRIFEKKKYPGWFSLSMIIPEVGGILYLVAIGFVAWKKK